MLFLVWPKKPKQMLVSEEWKNKGWQVEIFVDMLSDSVFQDISRCRTVNL
jgi:hypothetical protein